MAVMKKDVNIGLLLLIVATLLMFSGFTVYYQTTFKNISQNYNTKLDELNTITRELETKRSLLNETSTQLSFRKQQQETLDVKYDEIRNDRDALQGDKTRLELELSQTKTELAQSKSDLAARISELNTRKAELAEAYINIANLKSDITSKNAKIISLERKIACLKQTAGVSESC